MGFIDTSSKPELSVFYNVVHAVGKNCPNHKNDTKMVQYMLLNLYKKLAAEGFKSPKGEMKVDGICGPVTINWIQKFQLDIASTNPTNIIVDSRVDRIRNKETFRGELSGKLYTLYYLNRFLLKYNPEAFKFLPVLIEMQNASEVPPPSWDVIEEMQTVPTSGGA